MLLRCWLRFLVTFCLVAACFVDEFFLAFDPLVSVPVIHVAHCLYHYRFVSGARHSYIFRYFSYPAAYAHVRDPFQDRPDEAAPGGIQPESGKRAARRRVIVAAEDTGKVREQRHAS